MAPAGYSGTPLAKKLGIKPGHRVLASDNRPLQSFPLSVEQRVEPAHVFLINTALQKVIQEGTATSLAADTGGWGGQNSAASATNTAATPPAAHQPRPGACTAPRASASARASGQRSAGSRASARSNTARSFPETPRQFSSAGSEPLRHRRPVSAS